MKAALLLLLSAPGAAFWGGPSRLELPKKLFDDGKYPQVIGELSPASIGRMSSREQRQAYFYLGSAHERLEQLDKALGVYQLGVKLYPRDINLLTQLGTLLHRSGLEQQAEPLFQKVLSIHPNNAAAHLGLAQIDHNLGFIDRSAEHYERALETMSDHAPIWTEYAEVLLAARDWPTAELAARRSLALAETAEARYALALALRGSGRLPEAVETLALAEKASPARLDFTVARGLWLLEAGRHEEAAAVAETLLKSPQPPLLSHWIRARARLKRDDYRGAVEDLKRVAAAERAAPFASSAAKTLLAELGAQ